MIVYFYYELSRYSICDRIYVGKVQLHGNIYQLRGVVYSRVYGLTLCYRCACTLLFLRKGVVSKWGSAYKVRCASGARSSTNATREASLRDNVCRVCCVVCMILSCKRLVFILRMTVYHLLRTCLGKMYAQRRGNTYSPEDKNIEKV